MSRYDFYEVVELLEEAGCHYYGDSYDDGMGWETADGHTFTFPDPDHDDQGVWLDADVMDYIAANRWLGQIFAVLKRHNDLEPVATPTPGG
ncbi:hypothetical protein ACLNGM_15095 [Aureimonas phyllosphaerae]|uniref:hypothetical protein n=1 Tax=Aureimonas phyllosphaerae TaxID=1166078 RepID=UPI003A5BE504